MNLIKVKVNLNVVLPVVITDGETTVTLGGGSGGSDDLSNMSGKTLPKIATNTFNIIAVGLFLIVSGEFFFIFIRRRAQRQ